MKKICFNKDWHFTFENDIDAFSTFGFDKYSDASGACERFHDYNNWQHIDLPHDWAVTLEKSLLANTNAGAYPNTHYQKFVLERRSDVPEIYNIGWYRKQFFLDPSWKGKRIFIEFEGVFRDAAVWVNGVYLDRHNSGYTSFAWELTDHLVEDEENSIAVRVDSDQAEGWWYEGSGIYRNVNLLVGEPVYFKYNQTVVKTELDGTVSVSAVLVNDTPEKFESCVLWNISNSDNDKVSSAESVVSVEPYSELPISVGLKVDTPKLWSIDSPYLYTLTASAEDEQTSVRFGIRTVSFDSDKGFLLNGKPVKVRGACVHQDFGGVGVALTDNLQYYKIKKLQEMGVNAYRCAHHAPSPALLDACDELGMLVMNETRLFGTSPEAIRQLTDLIERDRNHPCVFIWSLGNEECSVQCKEWSYRLMNKVTRIAKKLDPTRPVTYGGSNGADFIGANRAAEVRGVNYIRLGETENWMDEYHEAHPDQPIIGTEEGSYVLSRGGAANDLKNGLLDSTGTVTMPWGSTLKGWVKFIEERDYFSGSFMWTGFDYRGEPNPFYYTNCASSFGAVDLCGMEKPPFYYYKSWWTDEPTLKITPHWNHKPGDTVTVAVFTNCERITLSLNGRELESREVKKFDAPLFEVPFESGILSVEGVRDGKIYSDKLETSGDTYEIKCIPVLEAENEDSVGIYELDAFDSNGRFCPLADEYVEIIEESGRIIGVGNGDPSNFDYECKPVSESVRYIDAFETDGQPFPVPEKVKNSLRFRDDWLFFESGDSFKVFEDDFRMIVHSKYFLQPEKKREFTAVLEDVQDYSYIEFERLGGKASVYLNGEFIGNNHRSYGFQSFTGIRPYRFYCNFAEGQNTVKVVFDSDAEDIEVMSGYVKIGKINHEPWQVKLHYGKARVFVKSDSKEPVKLNVKIK